MADIFKAKMKTAMADNFNQVKSKSQSVSTELNANMAAIPSDVDVQNCKLWLTRKARCRRALTMWFLSKVETLLAQVAALDNKCEDLELRSRRNNIRIIGLREEHGPVDETTISVLLKDALGLGKEPVVDCAHRSLKPKPKPGERPRPIKARLHYYADCAEILRCARTKRQFKVKESATSIFPDFTTRTAKARAAFSDIRRQLREIPDLRFGCLRITKGDVTREFTSPKEAAAFVKTLK